MTSHYEEMKADRDERERERVELAGQVAELHGHLAEKMALLDEFERKYAAQYADWQERLDASEAEVMALRADAAGLRDDLEAAGGARGRPLPPSSRPAAADGDAAAEAAAGELRRALEREVVLVDYIEQLERDKAREVEAALRVQRSELEQLRAGLARREAAADREREAAMQLEAQLEAAQRELGEQRALAQGLATGVYGLAEALRDVKALKAGLRDKDAEVVSGVRRLHDKAEQFEDVLEENRALRKKLGLREDAPIDLGDYKLKSQIETAQLRALNARLEREIAELEEASLSLSLSSLFSSLSLLSLSPSPPVKRPPPFVNLWPPPPQERANLKTELRFRAAWQGEHAAKLGLSPDQLLALEEFSDELRLGPGGFHREGRTVAQLEAQVKRLQARLVELTVNAEVGAELGHHGGGGGGDGALGSEARALDRRRSGRLASQVRQAEADAAEARAEVTHLAEQNRRLREEFLDKLADVNRRASLGGGQPGGSALPPADAAELLSLLRQARPPPFFVGTPRPAAGLASVGGGLLPRAGASIRARPAPPARPPAHSAPAAQLRFVSLPPFPPSCRPCRPGRRPPAALAAGCQPCPRPFARGPHASGRPERRRAEERERGRPPLSGRGRARLLRSPGPQPARLRPRGLRGILQPQGAAGAPSVFNILSLPYLFGGNKRTLTPQCPPAPTSFDFRLRWSSCNRPGSGTRPPQRRTTSWPWPARSSGRARPARSPLPPVHAPQGRVGCGAGEASEGEAGGRGFCGGGARSHRRPEVDR